MSISWHHSLFDLQGAFLHMCSQGGLLTSRMMNMWSHLLSGQVPASSLNFPVIPVSEYLSTRNELKPFALGAHLSLALVVFYFWLYLFPYFLQQHLARGGYFIKVR